MDYVQEHLEALGRVALAHQRLRAKDARQAKLIYQEEHLRVYGALPGKERPREGNERLRCLHELAERLEASLGG